MADQDQNPGGESPLNNLILFGLGAFAVGITLGLISRPKQSKYAKAKKRGKKLLAAAADASGDYRDQGEELLGRAKKRGAVYLDDASDLYDDAAEAGGRFARQASKRGAELSEEAADRYAELAKSGAKQYKRGRKQVASTASRLGKQAADGWDEAYDAIRDTKKQIRKALF